MDLVVDILDDDGEWKTVKKPKKTKEKKKVEEMRPPLAPLGKNNKGAASTAGCKASGVRLKPTPRPLMREQNNWRTANIQKKQQASKRTVKPRETPVAGCNLKRLDEMTSVSKGSGGSVNPEGTISKQDMPTQQQVNPDMAEEKVDPSLTNESFPPLTVGHDQPQGYPQEVSWQPEVHPFFAQTYGQEGRDLAADVLRAVAMNAGYINQQLHAMGMAADSGMQMNHGQYQQPLIVQQKNLEHERKCAESPMQQNQYPELLMGRGQSLENAIDQHEYLEVRMEQRQYPEMRNPEPLMEQEQCPQPQIQYPEPRMGKMQNTETRMDQTQQPEPLKQNKNPEPLLELQQYPGAVVEHKEDKMKDSGDKPRMTNKPERMPSEDGNGSLNSLQEIEKDRNQNSSDIPVGFIVDLEGKSEREFLNAANNEVDGSSTVIGNDIPDELSILDNSLGLVFAREGIFEKCVSDNKNNNCLETMFSNAKNNSKDNHRETQDATIGKPVKEKKKTKKKKSKEEVQMRKVCDVDDASKEKNCNRNNKSNPVVKATVKSKTHGSGDVDNAKKKTKPIVMTNGGSADVDKNKSTRYFPLEASSTILPWEEMLGLNYFKSESETTENDGERNEAQPPSETTSKQLDADGKNKTSKQPDSDGKSKDCDAAQVSCMGTGGKEQKEAKTDTKNTKKNNKPKEVEVDKELEVKEEEKDDDGEELPSKTTSKQRDVDGKSEDCGAAQVSCMGTGGKEQKEAKTDTKKKQEMTKKQKMSEMEEEVAVKEEENDDDDEKKELPLKTSSKQRDGDGKSEDCGAVQVSCMDTGGKEQKEAKTDTKNKKKEKKLMEEEEEEVDEVKKEGENVDDEDEKKKLHPEKKIQPEKEVTYGDIITYVMSELEKTYSGGSYESFSRVTEVQDKPLPDELTRHIRELRRLSFNYDRSRGPNGCWQDVDSHDNDVSFGAFEHFDDSDSSDEDLGMASCKSEDSGGDDDLALRLQRYREKLHMFAKLSHLIEVVSKPEFLASVDKAFVNETFNHSINNINHESGTLDSICTAGEDTPLTGKGVKGHLNESKDEAVDDTTSTLGDTDIDDMSALNSMLQELSISERQNNSADMSRDVVGDTNRTRDRSSLVIGREAVEGNGKRASAKNAKPMGEGLEEPGLLVNEQAGRRGEAIEDPLVAQECHAFLREILSTTDYARGPGELRRALCSRREHIEADLERELLHFKRTSPIADYQREKDEWATMWQGGDVKRTSAADDITKGHLLSALDADLPIDDDDLLEKGWLDKNLVDHLTHDSDDLRASSEEVAQTKIPPWDFTGLSYWWMAGAD